MLLVIDLPDLITSPRSVPGVEKRFVDPNIGTRGLRGTCSEGMSLEET